MTNVNVETTKPAGKQSPAAAGTPAEPPHFVGHTVHAVGYSLVLFGEAAHVPLLKLGGYSGLGLFAFIAASHAVYAILKWRMRNRR